MEDYKKLYETEIKRNAFLKRKLKMLEEEVPNLQNAMDSAMQYASPYLDQQIVLDMNMQFDQHERMYRMLTGYYDEELRNEEEETK